MRLLLSWLREFVDVTAPAEQIADTLALRGFEVASLEAVGRDDAVIDFEVTANRPDCLSVVGLAREVATAYRLPLRAAPVQPNTIPPRAGSAGNSPRVAVAIEDPELCPRYAAAVADVTIRPSPDWLASRLHAAGIRPISNLVDVTNYVLLELGHPMHAFDLAKLSGAEIRIRRAKPGETLRTLDDVERPLDPDMLVIADARTAQAVAGVMGGARSEVSATTTTVVFESAYFKPASVRRTSKRLGLKTEASARFERGADVNAAVVALERAMALMEQIGAGRRSGPVVDCYPSVREPWRLRLRRARLDMLLGAPVAGADVERILTGLGLRISAAGDRDWDVVVPTYRVDLQREVDLIEEVGRHYGFDRLAETFPALTEPTPPADERIARDRLVRRVLSAAGLSEAVTFGFIEAKAAAIFSPDSGGAPIVRIENPLSATFDTLRPSLLPGLVDAVAHNRRHGRHDVALFEIGTRFSSAGETRAVGIAWTGGVFEHWKDGTREVDFFDVKGALERLCDALGVEPAFDPAARRYLVDGQAAAVTVNGTPLGVVGLVAPAVADAHGAPRQDPIFVAELDLDAAARARRERGTSVRPLPRYPFVVRDLSIVVDDTLPAAIIRGTIQAAAAAADTPLVGLAFFDRYRGKGVPEGKVSVSVRLTFQAADRTLTDAEVQRGFDNILAALVREHGAVQR